MKSIPLPEGEMFSVSDRTILVDEIQTIAATGFAIGKRGGEMAVHITAAGKLNNSPDRADVTLMVSPRDALQLVDLLMHTLEAITSAIDKGNTK